MTGSGRNYIEGIKSFFRNLGGIIVPKAGRDLGVASGDNIYLDADTATPNDYITWDGINIIIVRAGANRVRINATAFQMTGNIHAQTDNTNSLGFSTHRYTEGFFSTEVGFHTGAAFSASLTNLTLNIRGLPQVVVSGVANETLELGEPATPTIPTVVSVASEAAITNPVNGMIYYNTTNNKLRGYENGAWQDLV